MKVNRFAWGENKEIKQMFEKHRNIAEQALTFYGWLCKRRGHLCEATLPLVGMRCKVITSFFEVISHKRQSI